MTNAPILLVGCGNMGKAMLAGWTFALQSLSREIHVVDRHLKENHQNIKCYVSVDDLPEDLIPEIVVLAVKPQGIDAVIPSLEKYKDACFLSIIAGKKLSYYAAHLGRECAVVRSMPNTPAAVGKSITTAVKNENVSDDQKALVDDLLCAIGKVCWINDDAEDMMDALSAVSGSAVAYYFFMLQAMTEIGVEIGLPEDVSKLLAEETFVGSAALLNASGKSPQELREAVTSKKGVTLAALEVLMKDSGGLKELLKEAVHAATKRSKELS